MVIFDLSWRIIFFLISNNKNQKRLFLLFENQKLNENLFKFFILKRILKIEVNIIPFKYSELRGKSGEFLTFTATKIAYENSLNFAVNKNKSIIINSDLKRAQRHLNLYLATRVYEYFYDLSNSLLVAENLITENEYKVLLTAPVEIVEFCREINEYRKVFFIRNNNLFQFVKIHISNLVMFLMLVLNMSLKLRINLKKKHGGVLVFTDRDANASEYLRSQFFWAHGLDANKLTIIVPRNARNRISNLEEISKIGNLVKLKICGLTFSKLNKINIRISDFKITRIVEIYRSPLSYNSIFKFTIGYSSYHRFVNFYGFKCMIHENTTSFETKIFDALAEDGTFKTIGIQYSNLNMRSLLMITNCSVMFIFSENFKSIFEDPIYSLGPKEFKICGYRFNYKSPQVFSRGQKLRRLLENNRKLTIISYFDENPNDRKWTLISHKDNQSHFETICNFVLENRDFAVIYKTQFVHKNPLSIYKNSELVEQVMKSGRLIFPSAGIWRNTITPAEVGFASDFAVGFKFGGTACLEVALTNRRVIMISPDNPNSEYNHFIYPTNILANSLSEALHMIKEIKLGTNSIGVWKEFINKLCSQDKVSLQEYIRVLIYDN